MTEEGRKRSAEMSTDESTAESVAESTDESAGVEEAATEETQAASTSDEVAKDVAEVEEAVAQAEVEAEAEKADAEKTDADTNRDAVTEAAEAVVVEAPAVEIPALDVPALSLPSLGEGIPSLVSGVEDVDSGWGDLGLGLGDDVSVDVAESKEVEAVKADASEDTAKGTEVEAAEVEKVEPVAPVEADPAKGEVAEVAKAEAVKAAVEAEPVKEEPVKEEVAKVEPEVKAVEPARPLVKRAAPEPEGQESTVDVVGGRESTATAEDRKSLQDGLQKTRGGFVDRLSSLFKGRTQIDDDLMEDIEEVLYTSDIGPKTVAMILDRVQSEIDKAEAGDSSRVWSFVRQTTEELLTANERPLVIDTTKKPFVILVVGVNGVGKTTTIGKLATRYRDQGHKVLLAAGDTFRAAATEQLEAWGTRAGMDVHVGQDGGDPASVVFGGIERGQKEGFDVVICDTAGRLTNKKNLMIELEKINRVAGKALDGAPHETLLVLDANTGMMAIQQAKMFQKVVDISGIVLTKLDGTAKGGVIIGISQELSVPVQFIGIGEGVYDLREFHARDFVDALFM